MGLSQDLYHDAKKIIPGGTQLLSKRPEMFLPDYWPAYYSKAKGCRVWDLDGNEYIDMCMMGIGSCILGYADDDVDKAVKEAIDSGVQCTLNSPQEVELAHLLCDLHPWAEMVRYARTGGEAMAVAVRIGRAKSGKDKVLFCGYHGWHDWYLASNLADDKALDGHLLGGLEPCGVPRALQGSSIPFAYNDTENFLKLLAENEDEVGVVVIESVRHNFPESLFLKTIRSKTAELGIVLIIDEVSAGWRLNLGGAHLLFEIEPDIAVFAKGMSNGYPMAAVIGTREVMDAAQNSFISSTSWTEKIGPVAAIAAIKKMEKESVQQHLRKQGKWIESGWKEKADKFGLKIQTAGMIAIVGFMFEGENGLLLKTLFTQLMLDEGFLASTVYYASYAHKDEHIEKYLQAVERTFRSISEMMAKGNLEENLKGDLCHSGFERLA